MIAVPGALPSTTHTTSPSIGNQPTPRGNSTSSPPPIMDAFGNPLELPSHIDPLQVLSLVDEVLPFEVCLYHRVIPLNLTGDRLTLGMVDMHDQVALDYVSKIAAYSDRTIIPTPLAGHVHQVLLSAYLHHSSQVSPESAPSEPDSLSSDRPSPDLNPVLPDQPSEGEITQDLAQLSAEQLPPPSLDEFFVCQDTTIIEGGLAGLHHGRTADEDSSSEDPVVGQAAVTPSSTLTPDSLEAAPYNDPTLVEEPSPQREVERLFPQLSHHSTELLSDIPQQALSPSELVFQSTESALSNSAVDSKPYQPTELPLQSATTLKVEQPTHLETQHPTEKRAQAIALRQQEQEALEDITHRRTLVLDEGEVMAELTQPALLGQSATQEPIPQIQQELLPSVGASGLSQDIVENVSTSEPSAGESSIEIVPANLDVLAHHPISQQPWEAIARLPAKAILQAVIGRMLRGDITRLRLERCRRPQAGTGLAQLLWNPAGVMQTAWEGFPLGAFGALARDLRQLAQIPMGAILHPIQRGVMRRYQGQPLLLLIQFLPSKTTAVIELRLLEGPALEIFQQHQKQDLGREALLTAHTLQSQIQRLLEHAQRHPEQLGSNTHPISPQLIQVIQQLHDAIASIAIDASSATGLSPASDVPNTNDSSNGIAAEKALVLSEPHSIISHA